MRRSRVIALVLPSILLYTLLAGAKPSIVRADVMATTILLAYLLDREPDIPSALALAALILLIWQPAFLFDPGFQLSFAVVAALVAVMPLLEPYLRIASGISLIPAPIAFRIFYGLGSGIALSFVAQISALPLTAQHFNQISPLGLVANTLILPFIPVLFVGGFTVWALASTPAAAAIAWPLGWALAYVIGVARTCGSVPWASLNVSSPGWGFAAVYYAAFAWIVIAVRRKTEGTV
jgi:competence protein ComEC